MAKGYPEPHIHEQTFTAGMNSDLADELMPHNAARVLFNCRVVSSAGGNEGVVTNIQGNVLITTPLPDGTNKAIAAAADERNNKFYFGVYNSNGYHTWYEYDELLNSIIIILQSRTDSNDIDILRWDPNYPILHVDIILGNGPTGDYTLLSYCDGLNKGQKINIQRALDKSDTGYGLIIEEDFITQYKKTTLYAPSLAYTTDPSRNSNGLYAQPGFKFSSRLVYFDGEISNYSDWSKAIYPPNQSYQGVGAIVIENNCIEVTVGTGSKEVVKIEIAMLTGTLNWSTVAILNKEQLSIPDNSTYVFKFYNDGGFAAADQSKINRPFSYMFRIPTCQAFIKQAMTQTGGDEGFSYVNVLCSIKNEPIPLFIPDGTENKLNNPVFTAVQQSYTVSHPFLSKSRYDPVVLFTVGADVKSGNRFFVYMDNGVTDKLNFNFTATLADTATTIAQKIEARLRDLGRGDIVDHGLDGGGNATFTYNHFGNYGEPITKFYLTVTPVEYASLKNNGTSVQVIKSGSTRQYAFGYEDDDQKKSQSYTTTDCAIRTPFLTEAPGGVLQQPVHVLSISHRPPIWAKRWMLYRTPDEINFIQILIQKVIDVVVIGSADPGEYLDLVVGSLFTYQQIHPDVIIKFDFESGRGDRLRLIKNTTADTLYTSGTYPYFETTILSYKEVTTEVRNAQITVDGTALVKPFDGVIADYVGKNILIGDTERTIVGITGDKYELDNIINIGANIITENMPNYSYIDRRGIIRIAKPSADFTVVDFSTVELYTPAVNTGNLDFKNFRDTAQKFEVLNWGTDQASHAGTDQDQDGTSDASLSATPAIVKVIEGDAWIRSREMPTNNSLQNTEVIVQTVEDPNFSDFYESSLNNLGRVYPTDDASGRKHFGSRTRFSNKYIVDTAINGLNDFDALDRVDNDDANGDVSLTKFRESRLYLFKKLKTGWMPVGQTIINTADGKNIVGTADKLLGDLQYYTSDAAIGDNPESWFSDENYMYFAATNTGTFNRVAGDGIDAISTQFGYDFEARTILSAVKKYKLKIFGAKDKKNDEGFWAVPEYVAPVFANPINQGDWITEEQAIPDSAVAVIVAQPAHGVVTYDPDTKSFLINMTDGYTGDDFFTYKFQLADSSFTATKKACLTVIPAPVVNITYRGRDASRYCIKIASDFGFTNDGDESVKILEGVTITGALSGNIMPNIQMISPDAIVPDGTAITFNDTVDVAPSAGANGDIWYNQPSDVLYKKIAGVWTALTNRAFNVWYQSPIQNLDDCPIATLYKNTVQHEVFSKQGCAEGHTGTDVDYIVPANTYGSYISQEDANNQALADIAANGQNYANTHGACSVLVRVHIIEQANPYSDANLELKNNGDEVARETGTGDTTHEILIPGGDVSFEAFSENPATGANPTKTMEIKKNGVDVYPPTSNSNNPGDPSLLYDETSSSGDEYDVYVTSNADAFPEDATGILVVDFYDDDSLDLIGYINTPVVTPYQQPAYVGTNFIPPATPAQNCYVLASDKHTDPVLKRRFEFNVAQLMSLYPDITDFQFIISGRKGGSDGTCDGQYDLQSAASGMMIMTGFPTNYLPSTSGTTNIDAVGFTGRAIPGGGDGVTYGLGVGAVVCTFNYNVPSKTMVLV